MRSQVEFIVMGGTFMSMPEEYRGKFIAQLHNALSGFTGTDVDEAVRFVGPVFTTPLPSLILVQILRAEQVKSHRYNHRDAPRLLLAPSSQVSTRSPRVCAARYSQTP